MQLVRGSHLFGRLDHVAVGASRGADPGRVALARTQFETVSCVMAPGDGMFFHDAVKSLKVILASQPNPTAALSLLSALAPARLALPQLQEALDAGKAMRVGQQVSQLRAVR